MTTESATPVNPVRADFAGTTPARTAKRLFHATRPKFFPASVLPVLVGTAWGAAMASHFELILFLLALLATVCVHAGSNVLNDVGDDSGGTDRQNELRIYPYTGGSRFIQTGILDKAAMTRLGSGLLLIAMIAGGFLIAIKGLMILYFGLAGIFLGVVYSLGPARLSALGLGETAVAVAFGVLPVAGAAWLQGATINADLILFAIPVSVWVAAILLINEVPDIDADGATGKRTLPVRLGLAATSWLYFAIHVAAVASIGVLVARNALPLWSPALPLLLLIPAWRASAAIKVGVEDRARLKTAIESTLGIHTVGSVWLIVCMLVLIWQASP